MGGAGHFCPNTVIYPRLGNTDIPDLIFFQMSFDGSTEGKLKAQNLLCALPLTPFISLEASKTTTELAVALLTSLYL